jgi:riboflavin kinase/FMN adenylyltransferase
MSLLDSFQPQVGGSSVALGFFDGFHRGHQAILAANRSRSDLTALVFTFRNHPASVISSARSPVLLSTPQERKGLLESANNRVVWCDFDRPFSELSPADFFEQILRQKLGAQRLVSGPNYRFGHRAGGDVASLRELAAPHGIEVVTVEGVEYQGELISSTRIRHSLAAGQLQEANAMLGRNFSLSARVLRGDQRGRQLGFPTANLPLPAEKIAPAYGVYAGWVLHAGQRHPGVGNLGVRPTIYSQGDPVLEMHLIDFDGDLYGQQLQVELCHYLRPEQRFEGLDQLKAQIEKDRDEARSLLRSPSSTL